MPLAIQEYPSGYTRRPVTTKAVASLGSYLAFHIYINGALAGPVAQEQSLQYHFIPSVNSSRKRFGEIALDIGYSGRGCRVLGGR